MECKNCGACCMYVTVAIPANTLGGRDLPWLVAHQCSIISTTDPTQVAIKIPNRCMFLNTENKCAVHGTVAQPEICKNFEVGRDRDCKARAQ